MKDYSSETASKFTRSTLDRQSTEKLVDVSVDVPTQCKEPIVHMFRASYASLPKPRSVPTRNTVSTCESKSANTRISLQLLLFNTISYYPYLVHVYFKSNAAEKLTSYVLWLIFTPPL